jgi:uncharacterized ubiquitin-like protein YukD
MIKKRYKYVETVYEDDTKVIFRLSCEVDYYFMVSGNNCILSNLHIFKGGVREDISIYELILDTGLIQIHEHLSCPSYDLDMTVTSISKKVILMIYNENDDSSIENEKKLIGVELGLNKFMYPMSDLSISDIYTTNELMDILISGVI